MSDLLKALSKAINDYNDWQFTEGEYTAEPKVMWDFLPDDLRERYLTYLEEGNSKRDMAISLAKQYSMDFDLMADDFLAMEEQEDM